MSDIITDVPEQTGPIIGIDLGTSTSSIAYLDDKGQPQLIRDRENNAIIPSVVQWTPEGNFLVGYTAKASSVTFPDRTAQEVKRLMGTSETVKLGEKTMMPEEVAAVILRYLKEAAEKKLGEPVRDVVLSVPARFENEAREATRRAAEMAGLNVIRLINEPTAAALSYGLDRLEDRQKVLVFDFGGGTLDVTVLEMFEGILDVKTSVGDDKLGGKDIDEAMVKIFREAYQEQKRKKLPAASRDRKIAQMLKEEAEAYKKLFAEALNVQIDIPYLTPEGGISMMLSRDTVEDRLEAMLMRSMMLVNEALSRARLRWEDIDVVLPVGGSSRMPLFRRALGFAWGRELKTLDNSDEAVVRGAAIAAGIERRSLLGVNEGSTKDIVILDVSPHRLGVATIKQVGSGQFVSDYFSEIIPKDTKLPATQQREYHTSFQGGEPITVRIYEASSDSNLCRDHRLVAELPLRNLYQESVGEPVQVEFRYTLDGTLKVAIQYVAAPMVKAEGTFTVVGGNQGTGPAAARNGTSPGAEVTGGLLSEGEPARWQDAPQADACAPLLEQAERLENQNPENSLLLRAASDAVKVALVNNDEVEIRRHLDTLTDLLFEMA